MRASIPTVHCDADVCIEWEPDEEAMCTTSINGLQITAEHRALGWFSTDLNDYCPDHAEAGRTLAGKESDR